MTPTPDTRPAVPAAVLAALPDATPEEYREFCDWVLVEGAVPLLLELRLAFEAREREESAA